MATIKAGEINLEYYVEGAGPPLLMIRGFGADCSNWGDAFLRPLQATFSCIRFSNRGTGLSDKPGGPTSIRQMADDAVALLDVLSVERAHVFGVSMGGMIAQEIAINHPRRVNGLVAGCTSPGGETAVGAGAEVTSLLTPEPGSSREDQLRKARPALVTQGFIEHETPFLEEMMGIALINPTPIETVVKQLAAIQTFDAFDRLPQVTVPTLVIHGDSDRLLVPENGAIIAGRIPGAELRTIAGVGHMFMWEKPAESASAIVEFLSRVPQVA